MGSGFRIHPDVAWRQVDGVIFILTPDSRFHQSDDEVGRFVWNAIATAPPGSPPNEDTLARQLAKVFDIDVPTATTDLREYLEQLLQAGALQRVGGAE